MYVANSANNRDLAAVVNGRIRSDAAMLSAKSVMWRLGGIGIMVLLTGCGVGAAFFGYSYLNDSRTSADKMAAAFAVALEHANLGTVRLNPEATVKMEPGTVSMHEPGTVKFDPGSMALVSGLQYPSERQLSGNGAVTPSATSPPSIKVVTNFTIFKVATFETGLVKSGWNFTSSDQVVPANQFCYYHDQDDGGGVTKIQDLARDGRMLVVARSYKNVDGAEAAKRCIWFNGEPTRLN